MSGKSRFTIEQRLASKTIQGHGGCLLFTGPLDKQGYGRIFAAGEKRLVHRVAHELFIGPIPDGYQVDHLCKVRHCIEPRHLEAVTPHENTMRSGSVSAINAAKTHCVNGHRFDEENTRLIRARNARACRACDRDRARAYRERQAA